MKKIFKKLYLFATIVALVPVATGCSDDDDDDKGKEKEVALNIDNLSLNVYGSTFYLKNLWSEKPLDLHSTGITPNTELYFQLKDCEKDDTFSFLKARIELGHLADADVFSIYNNSLCDGQSGGGDFISTIVISGTDIIATSEGGEVITLNNVKLYTWFDTYNKARLTFTMYNKEHDATWHYEMVTDL
ncbi:MAG: hypothetical protein LBQ13_04725 [Endomicrobium sp.]|jgi:hypothetical protein|nr:hypothetical protein [Endomicrobium sp.]